VHCPARVGWSRARRAVPSNQNQKRPRPSRDEGVIRSAVPPRFPAARPRPDSKALSRRRPHRAYHRAPFNVGRVRPSLLNPKVVRLAAPEGYSAGPLHLTCTGLRLAKQAKPAYSSPSSLIYMSMRSIMPEGFCEVNMQPCLRSGAVRGCKSEPATMAARTRRAWSRFPSLQARSDAAHFRAERVYWRSLALPHARR
jgi:hypothetical protein